MQRVYTARDGTRGCFELTGTHSVTPAPLCDDTHTHLVCTTALSSSFHQAFSHHHHHHRFPTHPSTTTRSWPPFPHRHSWIWRKKKRAGIFLSIPPGSLFFTLFFIPSPLPSVPAESGFFFCLTTPPPLHRVQTPRFFFTQDSRWRWLAEGRGQGKKPASRARPGGDSANHLSKQDRLFYSGVYFYFILFHLFFLVPSVRELFFSILTATFFVRLPFATRLSVEHFYKFIFYSLFFRFRTLHYIIFCTRETYMFFRIVFSYIIVT